MQTVWSTCIPSQAQNPRVLSVRLRQTYAVEIAKTALALITRTTIRLRYITCESLRHGQVGYPQVTEAKSEISETQWLTHGECSVLTVSVR